MFEKMRPFIREMGLRIVDFLVESQLDPECMGALFRVINALSKRQLWATSCKCSLCALPSNLKHNLLVGFSSFGF